MSPRVLVVDDEPSLCANLRAFLEDEGMEVFTTHSGEDALDLLNGGTQIDVVVTDMRLPGMDGNDTIRAIHAAYPSIRFAVHTGSSFYTVPDDLRLIGIGDECVFQKPLEDMMPIAEAIGGMMNQGRCDADE